MNDKQSVVDGAVLARHWWLIAVSLGVASCAKTESQAPARQAPSAVQGGAEEDRGEAKEMAPAAPPPNADQWPQAQPEGAAQEPAVAAPSPKKEDVLDEARKDKAGPDRSRRPAAAKPASAAGHSSGLGVGSDDEAQPALSLTESYSQLDVVFGQFQQALALAVPDCSAASRFRNNVCSLAEHICSLEQSLPTTAPRKCEDGKKRCSDATERFRAKCDE